MLTDQVARGIRGVSAHNISTAVGELQLRATSYAKGGIAPWDRPKNVLSLTAFRKDVQGYSVSMVAYQRKLAEVDKPWQRQRGCGDVQVLRHAHVLD